MEKLIPKLGLVLTKNENLIVMYYNSINSFFLLKIFL